MRGLILIAIVLYGGYACAETTMEPVWAKGCTPFTVDIGTLSGQPNNLQACELLADRMFGLTSAEMEKICSDHGGLPPQAGQNGSQCKTGTGNADEPGGVTEIEQIFCYKSITPGETCGIPLPGPSLTNPTYPFGGFSSPRSKGSK